jgi:hypothetical protein
MIDRDSRRGTLARLGHRVPIHRGPSRPRPIKELPVFRRVFMATVVIAVTLVAAAGPLWADDAGIGGVDPSSGPAGTEIRYTVVGPGPTSDSDCRGSSAFRTELLSATGTRIATGGDTIVVEAAEPGHAFLRLVCYIADETGRRMIRGVCAPFEVAAPGAAPGPATTASAGATLDEPCPPAPRVVASQSVITAQGSLAGAFNQVLTAIGA